MLWLETERIPPGNWPFLTTTHAGLREIEESLTGSIDLTEGNPQVTITGCLNAYRRAVLRRTLDLAQAVIASWNAGQPVGAVVCARALLETLATFHSLIHRAQTAADEGNWKEIRKLVDCYAFSRSPSLHEGGREPQAPPPVGRMVKTFIRATQPGHEEFWDQVCEIAHPNEEAMMSLGGILQERRLDPPSPEANEGRMFPALYNCLYSCCWLVDAMLDFDILCEHIRNGGPLSDDHPLVRQRTLIDRVVESVSREDAGKEPIGQTE